MNEKSRWTKSVRKYSTRTSRWRVSDFFFFQAEDGIRDTSVTGVQTCALPIFGDAGDAVPRLLEAGPIACEGLDERIIGGLRSRGLRLDDIALLPPGNAWIMLEFGGDTRAEAIARARQVPGMLIEDRALMNRFWSIRETGASATALARHGEGNDPVVGWE